MSVVRAAQRIAIFTEGSSDLARVALAELLRAIPSAAWLLVRKEGRTAPGAPRASRAPSILGERPAPGAAYDWKVLLADPRVRLHATDSISGDDVVHAVREFAPDLLLAVAAPLLEPSRFGAPPLGAIRLHRGLRPWSGSEERTAFWELYGERPELGCTVHRVESDGQPGRVLLRRAVPRRPFATLRGAEIELDRIGVEMTVETVARVLEGAPTAPAGGDRSLAEDAGGSLDAGNGQATWNPVPAPTRAQELALRRRLRELHAERPARRWMKGAIFAGYTHVVRPIPRRVRASLGMQRLVVLCYHRVNDDLRDSLTTGVEQFERQMRFLAERYPLVSVEDVVAGTFRRDTARPAVCVTFDDGYRDNWEFAAPVLARLRIPAGFFVTTGAIGNAIGFAHDRARLGYALPAMDWEHLSGLREMGFTIGSHTAGHVNFALADPDTLRRDLAQSRDVLRERLGVERPILAYPFGRASDMTPEGIALVRELGYAGCLSAFGGANDGPIDPYDIRRQGVSFATSFQGFQALIEGFRRPRIRSRRSPTPEPSTGAPAISAPRPEVRPEEPPLVVHVIHHLLMGGLENGLVNLVNTMPPDRYRHAIVCMAYYDDFRLRITRPDVEVYAMHVHERGLGRISPDLVRLFRRLRPAIVHSRNPSGLDGQLPALLAGVPHRIHGEHGWETDDLQGRNRKHLWNRRLHAPLIHHYVALSKHQERYLVERVGIAPERVTQIYNGVDTTRFRPRRRDESPPGAPWADSFVIGTVGRMQEVKDPLNLVEAFLHLRRERPDLASRVRLTMVGDGPLRERAAARLHESGAADAAWLPGARADVAEQLRGLDLFVLPSKAEGISNTILEAMATGLPVVATHVGGNPELVLEGKTGRLVPASDSAALAAAIAAYAGHPEVARGHGAAGRERARGAFCLERMVSRYADLYDAGVRHPGVPGPVPLS